jgi:hypothetical protein
VACLRTATLRPWRAAGAAVAMGAVVLAAVVGERPGTSFDPAAVSRNAPLTTLTPARTAPPPTAQAAPAVQERLTQAKAAAAATCTAGTPSDFNGDGVADVAVADPRATVDGKSNAGQVHIFYGGTGTPQTLTMATSQTGGTVATSDYFGFDISAYDANSDGCTDLAVGVPYEDVGTVTNAGAVYVLLGSPAGLAKGAASLVYHQDMGSTPDVAEAMDLFGYSVAGSVTAAGAPYLVVGVPGENDGSIIDSGVVHYYRGTLNLMLETTAAENDDQFGFSVAASTHAFAVGIPGEGIGTEEFSGQVDVFSSATLDAGLPKKIVQLHQNTEGVSGSSEAGDTFGKSVAIAAVRSGSTDSLLAVGIPGEDIGADQDRGGVQRFQITAAGAFTELQVINGKEGDGNYLGEHVSLASSGGTLYLAAGSPGQDTGETLDTGQILVFPALTTAVNDPVLVARRDGGLPETPTENELIGTSFTAGATSLWVGTPYGGDPAVRGIPWTDLAAGRTAPTVTLTPGTAAATTFGAVIS